MLVTAINIAENVAVAVPHRQFVFTMPKRFRAYFRYDRDLLKHLPRLAWETVRDVYRAVLDRDDVVPGMVGAPQSFGDLINWHPHVHALTTDGAFAKDGTFLPMPDDPPIPTEGRRNQPPQPSLVHRHYLYPHGERLPLPDSDHGLVFSPHSRLGAIEHHGD
jgi:hypothetical protein